MLLETRKDVLQEEFLRVGIWRGQHRQVHYVEVR